MIRNSLTTVIKPSLNIEQKQGVVSTTPAAAVAALAGFAAVAALIALSADGASALSAGYVKLSGGSDATKGEATFGIPATNAFTVRAKNAGVVTQDFGVVVAGNNTPESLVVTPGSIVYNAATNASGLAISTPQNIQNCILAHAGGYAVMDIGGGVLPGRVRYVAKTVGFGGNAIEVWHKNGAAEACTVLGTVISVTLDSGVSTSATIAALVNATPEAAALVTASPAVGGLVDDEVAAIALTGGITPASDIVEIDDLDGTSPVADEGPTALTGGAAAVAASGSLGVSGTNGLHVTAVTPGAAGNDIEVQIINIAGQDLNMYLEGASSIKIIPAAA